MTGITTAKVAFALLLAGALFALAATPGLAAPGDIVFEREGGTAGIPAAIFPHWVHRIRYRCYACHPAIFDMKTGAGKITMEDIDKGESCGQCHDGKRAFASDFQSCNRCHANPEE